MSHLDHIAIIRSDRKSVSLELKPDGTLLLRAPLTMTDGEINRFLLSKQAWLDRRLALLEERRAVSAREPKLTRDEIYELADKALLAIPPRVKHYAELMGVSYGRITIRNQTTRWGSCSSKGNLNFNCLLMLAPAEVRDYVIVHELCHLREMNHSAKFWSLVAAMLPDYKEKIKWLKEQGETLISRLRG